MGSWLPLLIILLAVALVIGPVMWLKPSGRDRRLASLRQRAAAAGMIVQMSALPESRGEGTAAVYIARWEDPRRLLTGWVLELQRMAHDMHFSGRWDWRNDRSAPEKAWQLLREMLAALPDDALGIHATQAGLGVQWREQTGDRGMDMLVTALEEFRPAIEDAIRQGARPDRSG
ncbi:hypothetical protein [Microbulbifer yueqingensis]|uniref:Preprotein translocase subunit YajC n=1 Tax=Microbulbifer yueqingensis TaxID=658219 RepID=A0A1G9A7K4_9GAMM|nr:hypothetical protein [Microbulbifer yueqingensis]SDK23273.1 hypothetical protein SAMN05216212_1882 [Microbulbifer yueqingensis]